MSFIGNLYGFAAFYNHSRGKIDKAEKMYKKACAAGMDKPKYKLAYGVLLLKKGEFQRAREIFSNVLVTAPNKGNIKITAKINLALAYWKLGNIDTAVEMLWEVHRKYRSARVYGALGYLLIEKGDLKKALEFNMEALDYDDEDPVILDNLAQTFYRMGKIEDAKKYFLKAEEVKENQPDTLYYLGCIYQQEGDIETARKKLQKALACDITPLNTVDRKTIEAKLKELV